MALYPQPAGGDRLALDGVGIAMNVESDDVAAVLVTLGTEHPGAFAGLFSNDHLAQQCFTIAFRHAIEAERAAAVRTRNLARVR